jgi:hypothetical protein
MLVVHITKTGLSVPVGLSEYQIYAYEQQA